MASRHEFDFLVGDWRVLNKRLKEPFSGRDEWSEFPARLAGSTQLLDGLALMERYVAELDGEPFEGVSLRLFDPATGRWTIYWMDTRQARLIEQVVGAFVERDGERAFVGYGEELFAGEPVKMRFVWDGITPTGARWEQAYWDAQREAWEANWIMEFTRIDRGANTAPSSGSQGESR